MANTTIDSRDLATLALKNHTSDRATITPTIDSTSNPWSDTSPSNINDSLQENRLRTPDPSLLDHSIAAGLEAQLPEAAAIKSDVSPEVLSEFDPLANVEEKAAREAWGTSEAHPPPPRVPSPPAPLPLHQDTTPPRPDSPSISAFPSLAALARTFSIPKMARSRPTSLDMAKPVPSPATISSFASQQEAPRNDALFAGRDNSAQTSTPSGSGSASPVSESRDKGEIPFDFQKFLDQLKSRSAEPVAKYLKSYASKS